MPASAPRPRRFLRRLVFGALLLLILLLWFALKVRGPDEARVLSADGERVFVADGDTLRIGQRTIRLAGIDAVELRQFCRAPEGGEWSCGGRARDALDAIAAAGGLACETRRHDRYRRDVARCSARNTPDIGGALVKAGWAINLAERGAGAYAEQQAEAEREGRGIWRGQFQQPALWRATHERQPKPTN